MNQKFLCAEEKGLAGTLRVFRLVFLSTLLAPALAGAATTIADATGRVFYLKAQTSVWGQISRGQVLMPGDQVRTAAGSKATISFDDGSRVELGPSGAFTLQDATPQSTGMKLGLGSLRAWVNKAVSRRFEVRTPTAVCSVRGTEFGVDVNPQGNTSVQMFSGLLAVADQAGNEVLIKDNQSISVTDKGLGQVGAKDASSSPAESKDKAAAKREIGLDMSKDEVQALAAIEAKNAIYQQGKAIIDVNGNRVRIEEYIIRPAPNQFKLVVLNERENRFDYFYYKGTFNTVLPDDISIALRQLPGCIGAACQYFMTGYETARSNTIDNMLEVTSGGHMVDVNNNGQAADRIEAAYDPSTDKFIQLSIPNPGGVGNTPFFKTLFNNYRLTFNGVEHSRWTSGVDITNMVSGQAGAPTFVNTTTVRRAPACAPPDCTYNEDGAMHQVVYASNNDGTIWEKYDSYIISDEGKIARTSDFSGITSGTDYKKALLNWNFQMIVTASEFQGRKIDLAVEPKIFIQSGLIP